MSALSWTAGLNLRRTGLFLGSSRAQGSAVSLNRAWERRAGGGSPRNRRLEAESSSASPKVPKANGE